MDDIKTVSAVCLCMYVLFNLCVCILHFDMFDTAVKSQVLHFPVMFWSVFSCIGRRLSKLQQRLGEAKGGKVALAKKAREALV